jgi:hypothetical protein
METGSDTELVALVTWLQTFESFPHRIVDGSDGKIALETVLDALGSKATARYERETTEKGNTGRGDEL